MNERYDVVIVGAGVIGCAIAYYASRAGLRSALLDKGPVAGEASQAGAGMLAPLTDHPSELTHHFSQLCLAGLHCYQELDQELKDETGIDIELLKAPTLRPAFDEQHIATYHGIITVQEEQLVDNDVQALDQLLQKLATVPTPSAARTAQATTTFIPLSSVHAQ